jgi:hypothetical protein
MPVSVLLCEGGAHSPDVRLLTKLLAGRCEVRPFGGKYGMGSLVKGMRRLIDRDTVFGILDGDFADVWMPPTATPQSWVASDGDVLGWRWERKEIENYLIDPAVVARALGTTAPNPAAYQLALESARDRLTLYQAARAALSRSRQRFSPLACSFGRQRGREGDCLPDATSETACREGIRECVEAYNVGVTLAEVYAAFDVLKAEFAIGGIRHDHYLYAFAGKDLLWMMDSEIRGFGFDGVLPFRERLLVGIYEATDDIGLWLPEWKALQEAVDGV